MKEPIVVRTQAVSPPAVVPASVMRDMASQIVDRTRLAARAGLPFDGKRDMYEVMGYNRTIRFLQYLDRYRRDAMATRVVDAFPMETWQGSPRIFDGKIEDEPGEFEDAVNEMAGRIKLWEYILRVDRLSGIGRFGVLFMGINSGRKLEEPVGIIEPDDILYLSAFHEGSVDIKTLVGDPSDSRFGFPEMYEIDFSDKSLGTSQAGLLGSRKVHASRVIHVSEFLEEDEVFARPRMERVWNLLDDLAKVVGGSAETFWLTANRGLALNVDKEMSLKPADLTALEDEIEEYQHQLRRSIRLKGVEVKDLGSDVADPTGSFNSIISLLSVGTGIPQRILLGSERGQLASTQDRLNFNNRIRARQLNFAEPGIVRPFIDRMIKFGALPEPEGGDYALSWPDLSALTETERAEIAQKIGAGVKSIGSQRSVNVPMMVITPEEFRVKLGLPAEIPETEAEGVGAGVSRSAPNGVAAPDRAE